MVAGQRVAGGVTGTPDFTEELGNLARQEALIPEPSQQVELRLFRGEIKSNVGGRQLRQELSKLAELEKAGVRIIGEVPLRQQPQTQELIVMLLQMGEIGCGQRTQGHRDSAQVLDKQEDLYLNAGWKIPIGTRITHWAGSARLSSSARPAIQAARPVGWMRSLQCRHCQTAGW